MSNITPWFPYICWYFVFLGILITNSVYGLITGLFTYDSSTPHFTVAALSFFLFIVLGVIGINLDHTPGIFGN